VAKARNHITKREFVKRFTDLTLKHLSTLTPEKQEAQLKALEKRASKTCPDSHSTISRTPETPAIRLAAQNPHEEA